MWSSCGVVRDERGLREGLAHVDALDDAVPDLEVRADIEGYGELAHAFDLRFSLVAARATLLAALERRESRGAHVRRDFPELAEEERTTVRLELRGGEPVLRRARVEEPPRRSSLSPPGRSPAFQAGSSSK